MIAVVKNVRAAAMLFSYVRFFHPSAQAIGVASWDHVAIDMIEKAEPATDAADLAARLKEAIGGIAPTIEAAAPVWPADSAAARNKMRFIDFSLFSRC